MSSSFFHAVLRDPGAKHTIRNTRNQRVLAEDVMAAFDSRSRRTGLLKHNSLPKGSAMLIAPTNAVHTFFMRFPIDIAFVTREGTILKACAAVRPWRIAAAWNAKWPIRFGRYAFLDALFVGFAAPSAAV